MGKEKKKKKNMAFFSVVTFYGVCILGPLDRIGGRIFDDKAVMYRVPDFFFFFFFFHRQYAVPCRCGSILSRRGQE
ncbi:hypothetical protein GGS20DRAFT_568619 [Poronia punctata]|nr:hypothetical protein GGS20DRAFT_568619 [Poronia punctata]